MNPQVFKSVVEVHQCLQERARWHGSCLGKQKVQETLSTARYICKAHEKREMMGEVGKTGLWEQINGMCRVGISDAI